MGDSAEGRARTRPTYLRGERDLLDGWLEFHRATLLLKCEGISDELRRSRPVASSLLSLHGLVRHLAETERNWFSRILEEKPDLPRIWYDPSVDGSPLVPLDEVDWDEDLATYRKQCDHSRRVAASRTLDDCGVWREKLVSMRSVYLHMIQEYARHNGHADIIRELLDGVVGL
ncbi:DinB family protein [Pseudofrankia asymbiotica]|uniref:Mini-circle protein n=1 Tax=Pseudofrankia asymbiotica TaxID=1834516 RepID=A0A1V2IFK9_9ACTN|nr:DinB family protein [Pseudofrankia asymbiotica]ONH31679.1 hypothetical protein BL253_08405 [Pseudofrankia asymbiotica]